MLLGRKVLRYLSKERSTKKALGEIGGIVVNESGDGYVAMKLRTLDAPCTTAAAHFCLSPF